MFRSLGKQGKSRNKPSLPESLRLAHVQASRYVGPAARLLQGESPGDVQDRPPGSRSALEAKELQMMHELPEMFKLRVLRGCCHAFLQRRAQSLRGCARVQWS